MAHDDVNGRAVPASTEPVDVAWALWRNTVGFAALMLKLAPMDAKEGRLYLASELFRAGYKAGEADLLARREGAAQELLGQVYQVTQNALSMLKVGAQLDPSIHVEGLGGALRSIAELVPASCRGDE